VTQRVGTAPDIAELARRRDLRRMKGVATGLLVLAAVVYLVARANEDGGPGWVGYVRAFAEAAMVGALADWFAVTALFRYPLGLPIPHTAIIPRRKDQIGRSLGEFVEGNFLTREVLDDRDVQGALGGMVERRLRRVDAAPLLARAVDVSVEGGHHQRLLDGGLRGVATFLEENRATLRGRLTKESPWWVPEPLDDRIFNKIFSGVQHFLAEVGDDPDHEVRRSIEARVIELAERLRTDPEMIARVEELKDELLSHPEVQRWFESLWGSVKHATIEAAGNPTSELRVRVTDGLRTLGERLVADEELQAKIDDWLERALAYVVDNYKSEVADLIATTVERWDSKDTSRRIELQVGRDLQFIRINGTVVGGIAGVLIHTVGNLAF
jgi:uncharacterized membrane-anchored protein YjiN (DUF445 family)